VTAERPVRESFRSVLAVETAPVIVRLKRSSIVTEKDRSNPDRQREIVRRERATQVVVIGIDHSRVAADDR
jgi:hypothetical protein